MFGILMSDIVDSSQFQDVKSLHLIFNETIQSANQIYKKKIISPLTITLGDEFQGLVDNIITSFDIALFIRWRLLQKGISTRFVIGEGKVETEINHQNAWNMMSTSLTECRKILNRKNDKSFYRFYLESDRSFESILNVIGENLTFIEEKWTPTQQKYVMEVFFNNEKPKAEIANELGISRNTLYKSLRSANFDLYESNLQGITKYFMSKKRKT